MYQTMGWGHDLTGRVVCCCSSAFCTGAVSAVSTGRSMHNTWSAFTDTGFPVDTNRRHRHVIHASLPPPPPTYPHRGMKNSLWQSCEQTRFIEEVNVGTDIAL